VRTHGLLGPNTAELTLSHAVFLRCNREHDLRLLRLELRHVQQHDRMASVGALLAQYLCEIVLCD
jgi:hypothetical protein